MIRSRILEPSEYGRLAGTELEAIVPYLPTDARVLAVEQDGRLVACLALYPQIHAEGLWMAPDVRGNPVVMRRLLRGIDAIAAGFGARAVWMSAIADGVVSLIERIGGYLLPGRHFSVRVPCVDAKKRGE